MKLFERTPECESLLVGQIEQCTLTLWQIHHIARFRHVGGDFLRCLQFSQFD